MAVSVEADTSVSDAGLLGCVAVSDVIVVMDELSSGAADREVVPVSEADVGEAAADTVSSDTVELGDVVAGVDRGALASDVEGGSVVAVACEEPAG